MLAWMVLGCDKDGRLACFFVHNSDLWEGLGKQHQARKGLREGELSLLWPCAGGDHVFGGATVLTVSNSTIIRALADYGTDVNVWQWHSKNYRNGPDLTLEDWQLCAEKM